MSGLRQAAVVFLGAALLHLVGCDAGKVCEPNALQCSPLKNRLEQCNADGSAVEVVGQCPGNTCVEAGGTASCDAQVEPVCAPGERRCGPLANRIEVCSADGSGFETETTCAGNTCVASGGTVACDDQVETSCAPGERRCGPLANRVEVCKTDGSGFETETTCAGNTCVASGGTVACDDPAQACSPGATRCSATSANVVETCDTTGSGWVAQAPCQGTLTCLTNGSGAGVCQSCVPGATQCGANNGSVETCNEQGTAYVKSDTCGNGSCKLEGSAYACEFPCTPGETRCGLANQMVQACNASGDAYVAIERCLDNSCAVEDDGALCRVPEVCSPGARRCSAVSANVIEECNTSASGWFARTTCAGALTCLTNGSGAGVCQSCVPGSTQCGANNGSVETCNEAGTGYAKTDTCNNGSCKLLGGAFACEYPCTPGETRCGLANQTVQACDATGASYVFAERCLDNSCTTAAGPATCAKPEVCTPGTRRCSATADNQVEQCNAQGSGWYLQSTCAGALECTGTGTCQSCVPGSRACGANNASVQVCNATGTGMTLAETCTGNSCGFVDGVFDCEYPCTAGQTRCSFNRARVEVCDANGTTYATQSTCLNNSCGVVDGVAICGSLPICTPGERRCSATAANVVEQCNTTGTGWFAQTTCGGALACSTASGGAACESCAPGARRCGANNASVEVCNAAGTAYSAEATCAANSCKILNGVSACEYPCTPGETRCSSTNSQVQVCNAAGDGYTLAESCLFGSCADLGALAFCALPQVCLPGTRRCSASASNAVEQCRTGGDGWFTQTTCGGALQCTVMSSGSEGCQLCVPGSRYCGANNGSVMECNALGTAFEAVETCANSSCGASGGAVSCAFPCVPGTRRCSPLRNRVDECDPSGTAVTTVATCANNSCTEALGTASCEPPSVECVSGESRCSPLGTRVEACGVTGEFETLATCPAADCGVVNGVAACAAPVCAPNTAFCGQDGDVRYCTSSGQDGGMKRDCDATEACLVLDGAAQCVAAELALSCEPGLQFCGDDGAIYYCNADGQVSGVRTMCGGDEICVVEANAPVCLEGYYQEVPGGEPTCVVTEGSTCVVIPRGGTATGFVYAESEKLACDEPAQIVRECGEQMGCSAGRCTSSVLDEASPYYELSCPLDQQLAVPTALEADCRCFINNAPVAGIDVCGRPYDRATKGVTIGGGPRLFGLANAHFSGGFVDGQALVVAAYWGSSTAQRGAVLSIDVDTGDRRLVSGDLGATTAGTGPALSYALDVRKGPDGKYYAFTQSTSPGAPSIVRIDPTTGNRTLVWRGQDASFGQCAAGDPAAAGNGVYLQYTNGGFAVEPAGTFLVGYANPIRDGRGLVRVAANGASCTFVTATGVRADGLTRGTGPELGGFVQGFTIDGGKVWVHTTQPKALVEVDLASGNRTTLFSGAYAGSIGERWSVRDATRGVIWTAGLVNSVTVVAYDRAKNRTLDVFSGCGDAAFPWYPLCPGAGPIKINSLNYGGLWLHPRTGNLLLAQDAVSIIEFEPETANSVIRSL